MKFKTTPMEKEWNNELSKKIRDKIKQNPDLKPLRELLLSFGGEEVCLPVYEEDLEKILNRGEIRKGTSKMMKGKPCSCHSNSVLLWNTNKNTVSICTGYALSKDGVWRQHTWCIGEKIFETTVKRVAYFGFKLTNEESEIFYDENY